MQQVSKVEMRRALRDAGKRTRGLSDDELKQIFEELEQGRSFPRDTPKAPSKPKPKQEFKKPDGLGEPEPEVKPDQQPQPAPVAVKGDGIASAIEAAIAGALQQPQIDEKQITDLIKKHSNMPQRIEYELNITRPDGEARKIKGAHHLLSDILDVAAIGENVYVAGPAAAGKTTLAQQAADALGFDFQYTGAIADQFQLSGFIDANGTYHQSSMYKALTFAERGFDGCVFLIDEADACLPAALLAANAAFENGYFEFPTGRVEFDKRKLFFICAANTKGKGANRQYTGRFPLDDAFLNRFVQLEADYDLSVEMTMSENAWLDNGGDPEKVDIARDWAHEVVAFRRQLADKQISVLVTPRQTRQGAGLLVRGWPLKKVREILYTFLNADQRRTLGIDKK